MREAFSTHWRDEKARKEHVIGCIQKFPDWPPGARTANGTAPCHEVQLYLYFVSQSSEFCRHNHLCCSQRAFIAVSIYFVMTQSGNFWIHPHRKGRRERKLNYASLKQLFKIWNPANVIWLEFVNFGFQIVVTHLCNNHCSRCVVLCCSWIHKRTKWQHTHLSVIRKYKTMAEYAICLTETCRHDVIPEIRVGILWITGNREKSRAAIRLSTPYLLSLIKSMSFIFYINSA
jgi:hypothetical protein